MGEPGNNPQQTDTIAAVATPPGRGGIGVIRVSGPLARSIAEAVLGQSPRPRYATHAAFIGDNGEAIDDGVALLFVAPNSFTGEDVLELQGHGGPAVLDMILKRLYALGARAARPGEFSERAFLNGKLDLAQAEAIADLIESSSEQAARAALRSLQGRFSDLVNAVLQDLIALRSFVESAIDFPDEEIDYLSDASLNERIALIQQKLDELISKSQQGRVLRDGINIVLAGAPNAGKSSLMNLLAREDTAIVSDIPGTTRDVIREHIVLKGLPVHLLDTAGLREAGDQIESEGVRRARAAMQQADLIILMIDDSAGSEIAIRDEVLPAGVPVVRVYNKIDLSGRHPGMFSSDGDECIAIAAKTGAGIDALIDHIVSRADYQPEAVGVFSARRRHLDALGRAKQHVEEGRYQLQQFRAGELLAEELRQAQRALSEITGEFSSEDLLGEIFSGFCIGK